MFLHRYKPAYKNYTVVAFPVQEIDVQTEIRTWCYQTFGVPGYKTDTEEVRWVDYITYGEVRIDRESDLVMFLLRWE